MVTLRLARALLLLLLLGLLVGCGSYQTSRLISIASPEISVQTGTSDPQIVGSLKGGFLPPGAKAGFLPPGAKPGFLPPGSKD